MDREEYDRRDEFVGGTGRGSERRDDSAAGIGQGDAQRDEFTAAVAPGSEAGRRREGLRRVRHMSNWTAAALLAGTGVATVALASQATQTAGTATASSYGTQGTSVQPGAPHVHGSVVTSGGSGATMTTTTKVVNGKIVVTKARHPAVWHDS